MRNARMATLVIVATGLALLGLAEVRAAQGEKNQKSTVELVWDKEFPEGITDVAFDKEREGLFCPSVIVTGNCENAKAILYLDSSGKVIKETKLKEWTQVRISQNGQYIGIMHPEKYDGEFHHGPVDVMNMSGKVVKTIGGVYGSWWWVSPSGNEIIGKDVWADDDVYYFRGTPGKTEANLTKREGDISMLAGIPTIKWTETQSNYLQIGNKTVDLPCRKHGHLIAVSPDGKYVAIPEAIPEGKSYIYHLLLYTKEGTFLEKFDLEKEGSVLSSFSPDGKFLTVAVRNLVFLIDVGKKKILWKYESDDPYQLLNLGTTLDFPSEAPFFVAGVFWHYEKLGSKDASERIMIFSEDGSVILDFAIGKGLNRGGRRVFKVNSKGNMLCYVTGNEIRVFQLRRTQ
ncbi:hypothetical protein E3J62_09430 [candidate division TA06 bacterium]|uniref:WD40 repeat domain-containing protein n=1 Tax=candidate division TA06 bacterium TaxID=2250710 RepID=A0A523UQE9_UNCT6|nr:MAG: hypothetical protein E3J62_09430 [candidate division TA06 bacterium]